MGYNVSGSGLSLTVVGSVTFPQGFTLTAFADDSDPLDLPSFQIAQVAMNINGDMVSWEAPVPIPVNIAVIAGSEDDLNLQALFEANRAAKGKKVARDEITITANYPDGSTTTVYNGKLLTGSQGRGVSSSGRSKGKAYTFSFQDISTNRSTTA